jgi:hypothetical protein
MDEVSNPFAPGAGTQPPEFAGREWIVSSARVALGRIKAGRSAKSQLMLGLRGVGKTVLLNRIAELAAAGGYETVVLEAPEDRALAEMIVPPLRHSLFQLSAVERASATAKRALGVLRAFAKAFKLKVGDVEFTVDAAKGTADSGSLESDLPELLLAVAAAAQAAGTGVAVLVDELQYLSEEDLAALIVAAHRVAQKGLPLVVFGAGLPQLAGLVGEAKSYAERLFEFAEVGPLDDAAARHAIEAPLRRSDVRIEPDALEIILRKTQGYPYFLQEWGYHAWNAANGSPIVKEDSERASAEALRGLDRGFFRVRFDRLTRREKDYVRAMAELGPGIHRSGEIAEKLGMAVMAAGPLRNTLIRKGMIYSPQHGDTAFTVPMFDEFMKRSMPTWTAGAAAAVERSDHSKARKRKKTLRRS